MTEEASESGSLLTREAGLGYALCDACLRRQVSPARSALRVHHPHLRQAADSHDCYICKGLLGRLDELQQRLEQALRGYEFRTFLVGAALSPDYAEREDEVRAELKLRGGEPLKSELTRQVGQRLARRLRKKVDFRTADLTLLLHLPAADVEVKPRPVTVFGRYRKERRGLPQRHLLCPNCRGSGCKACGDRGYRTRSSVESILARILKHVYRGSRVRFTWIGSEDRQSLVLGRGRPFFAEVLGARHHSPSMRNLQRRPSRKTVHIQQLRVAHGPGRPHLRFRSKVRALIHLPRKLPPDGIQRLSQAFRDLVVSQRAPNARGVVQKRVKLLRIQRVSDQRITLTFMCDGGLNIKRWVEGGEDAVVRPSIASTLNQAVRCERFDILDVTIEPRGFRSSSVHKR